ncbi:MAG: hypothetical protein U0271_40065 [Polyangiaceae bacterium]
MSDPNASAVVAPQQDQKVVVLQDTYTFDPGGFPAGFKNRFKGIVDRKRALITLWVDVAWVNKHEGWKAQKNVNGPRDYASFQQTFKSVVETGWSQVWKLKPDVPFDGNLYYKCKVYINNLTSTSDPHQLLVTVWDGYAADAPNRSFAQPKNSSQPDSDRLMDLKTKGGTTESDISYQQQPFPPSPKTPTTQFSRCTAVHEFGHHIGLHHPLEHLGNSDDAYGRTEEEARGVMGWGNVVKKENYSPFIKIAERFYAKVSPSNSNKWTVVSSDSGVTE